jgi:WD40 repeat protein
VPPQILAREASSPRVVRFSPRGSILAAGLEDGTIGVWMVEQFARPMGRVSSGEAVSEILYSPRLSMLLSLGSSALRAWRIPDLGMAFELPVAGLAAATFLADGNHLAVAAAGCLRVYDLRDRTVARESGPLGASVTRLDRVGEVMVALCDGRLHRLGQDLSGIAPSLPAAGAHAFALQPRGELVALISDRLRVLDMTAGDERFVVEGEPAMGRAGFSSAAFTTDGRLLLAGTPQGPIPLWDMHHRRASRVLEGHAGPVHAIDLWHGRARLASCGEDGTIRLWDLRR